MLEDKYNAAVSFCFDVEKEIKKKRHEVDRSYYQFFILSKQNLVIDSLCSGK